MPGRVMTPGNAGTCAGERARAARIARELRVLLLVAMAVSVGALTAACAPALAFSQHGHSFAFTFGTAGTGLGQFAEKVGPAGVAVSESTGDVYVVDPGNQRVEKFGPPGKEGEPNPRIATWGWGVSDGKAEFEVCTTTCQAGIAGTGEGQFDYPTKLKAKGTERTAMAIAVDNSTEPSDASKGDVYVVSNTASEQGFVEKFGPNGEKLGRVALVATGLTKIGGLAVQANGQLWAETGSELGHLGELQRFTSEQPNKFLETLSAEEVKDSTSEETMECPAPGLAVDAKGETLYVDHERLSLELELCTAEEEEAIKEEKKERKENGEPEVTRKAVQLVVAAKMRFGGEPPAAELLSLAMDRESTSALATDESTSPETSGDVYLGNQGEVSEKPVSSVAAFNAKGEFVQRFGQKTIGASAGIGVDSPASAEPGAGDVYVSDWKKGRVDVFEQEPPGAPLINEQSAVNIDSKTAELKALIDPRGEATKYLFEYGTNNCSLPESGCTKTEQKTTSAVFGDVPVTEKVTVAPGTKYYFRVVASNALGPAKNAEGPEGTELTTPRVLHSFTSLPQAGGLLPDNRQWEMVSPPNKEGATLEAIGGIGGGGGTAPSVGIVQAAEDGGAITYSANTSTEFNPQGNRAPESQQIISKRSPSGWTSKDVVTPQLSAHGLPLNDTEEYRAFSTASLESAVLRPVGFEGSAIEEPGLIKEGEPRNIFVRHNFTAACEAFPTTSGCYTPLVTEENDKVSPKEFGASFEFLGGTADLHRVVFRAGKEEKRLLNEDEATDNFSHLYEWTEGAPAGEQLKFVDVMPKLAPEEPEKVFTSETGRGAGLGAERENETDNARNAISKDGSRVFWTGAHELYMRDLAGGRTLQVSEPEPGLEAADLEHGYHTRDARFQAATPNGEIVFFTDDVPLTHTSLLKALAEKENERPPFDLYACRVIEESGKLKCVLTDLTIDRRANLGEDSQVTGLVLGEGGEGAEENKNVNVYFVTGGALTPDAKAGRCSPPAEGFEARCNIYVEHLNTSAKEPVWEEPALIANVSAEDAAVWGNNVPHLFQTTSRISPNGRFLAFMSNSELTGYDNRDKNNEAVRDEEVFLYDASHETLTCVSCNPSGERPVGVTDEEKTSEGKGLLVDRPFAWIGRTLAGSIPTWTYVGERHTVYQSHFLTDEGRLFFNSPDELVKLPEPEKYVNKENVYEYEPAGAGGALGTCASANGCVALISSGISSRESAFLDATPDGSSAFFLTAERLVAADEDEAMDVYDARECSAESKCIESAAAAGRKCETTQTCHGPGTTPEGFQTPISSVIGASGNVPKTIERGETSKKPTGKPKPTRAQLLKAALKKCHKLKKRKKRKACERAAKKRYAAKKASRHRSRGHR